MSVGLKRDQLLGGDMIWRIQNQLKLAVDSTVLIVVGPWVLTGPGYPY